MAEIRANNVSDEFMERLKIAVAKRKGYNIKDATVEALGEWIEKGGSAAAHRSTVEPQKEAPGDPLSGLSIEHRAFVETLIDVLTGEPPKPESADLKPAMIRLLRIWQADAAEARRKSRSRTA